MEEFGLSRIVLTHNREEYIQSMIKKVEPASLRVFAREEFNMDFAREVISEAFITTDGMKQIIISADSYNLYAQSALLKILEEPPASVRFILLASNKSVFLPTVLSRLLLEDRREKLIIPVFSLNLKTLGLKEIYVFLKENKHLSQSQTREQIQSLLFSIKKEGISLNREELDFFDKALLANKNYQNFQILFAPLLLMILKKRSHVS